MPERKISHRSLAMRIEALRRYADEQGWHTEPTNAYPEEIRDLVSSTP